MNKMSESTAWRQNSEITLTKAVAVAVTFQEYGETSAIAGVRHVKLAKHRGENGWFTELMRIGETGLCEGAGQEVQVRQISVSHAEAGRINAFHIHPRLPQDELWMVVSGSMLVWLVDCRAGSVTEGQRQSFVLTGEEPSRLLIPAGVAHGYKAGSMGAMLVYAMNQQFQIETPNEGRLPWDFFGPEIWDADRG